MRNKSDHPTEQHISLGTILVLICLAILPLGWVKEDEMDFSLFLQDYTPSLITEILHLFWKPRWGM